MSPIKIPERKITFAEGKYVALRLWRYLCREKGLLLLSFALTLAGNLLALAGPLLSGHAIDAIGTRPGAVDFPRVFLLCGVMLAFYALSSLLTYLLSVLMIRLGQRTVRSLRKDLFDRLSELPVGFYDRVRTGDLVSRFSYDADTVNASLSTDLMQVFASAITVGGSLLMMAFLSPALVSVFAVTIPISLLFTRYMARKVHPLFRRRSARLGELNGFAEEIITGLKTVRAYHQEETMTGRFDRKNAEAVDAYYRAEYYGSMTGPAVNFVNNLSLSLISVFGALMVLSGSLSLGALSSFVLYSRKFSGPINELANIMSELQSACAAAERMFRLIDEAPEPPDPPGARALAGVRGAVEMEHVRFGYSPGRTVIHDLSLAAAPGSLTAIVGPTGAGKTTLINLLMRFYDPDAGEIRIDRRPTGAVTRKSLRLAFAMVLQDTWLFGGSIFENIAYGRPGATMDEVVEAAKAARIHSFIAQLPDGYNTIVSEDGINLSKGQKQMLTIARAMLLDAKMLILDEATSNVDTRTERLIQDAMRRLMKDKTCFVIAHRLSTIQNADNILVVRDGNIVEQGNHAELMRRRGFYYELYRAQFA